MDPQSDQQGQEQQQSSVDRINNWARGGKSAYRKYKRAKNLLYVAKQGATAARAGAAAVQATASLVSNPVGIVVLIIVIIALTLFIVIIGGGGASSSQSVESGELLVPLPKGTSVEASSPDVNNNSNIKYSIKVTVDSSFDGDVNDLILTFVITYEHSFISDSPNNDATRQGELGKAYIWNFSEHPQPNNVFNFELVVDPTRSDFVAEAKLAVATYIPSLNDGQAPAPDPGPDPGNINYGIDSPPTDNTCGGRWRVQMDKTEASVKNYIKEGRLTGSAGTGYNFGDPVCSFSRDKLKKVIDEYEINDDRANFWMDITYCEGTPNSFGNQDSPMGPAGHFQMGIGQPIVFKPWQADKPNRGDVTWQRQAQNAVKFNNGRKAIGEDFTYWGAARCLCYFDEYKKMNYCDDIVKQGLQRSPAACGNDKCVERGRQGPTP